MHSLLYVYFKFTAPLLCLIYGARGGHGKALARCAPAPGGRLRHCGTGLTVEVCWAPAVGVGAVGADARPAGGFHLRRGGRVRAPPYRSAHGNAGN